MMKLFLLLMKKKCTKRLNLNNQIVIVCFMKEVLYIIILIECEEDKLSNEEIWSMFPEQMKIDLIDDNKIIKL